MPVYAYRVVLIIVWGYCDPFKWDVVEIKPQFVYFWESADLFK